MQIRSALWKTEAGYLDFFSSVLTIEPRNLYILGKGSTTELFPQTFSSLFSYTFYYLFVCVSVQVHYTPHSTWGGQRTTSGPDLSFYMLVPGLNSVCQACQQAPLPTKLPPCWTSSYYLRSQAVLNPVTLLSSECWDCTCASTHHLKLHTQT